MKSKKPIKNKVLQGLSSSYLALMTALVFTNSGLSQAQTDDQYEIEEIIVSAQKREQNLMDVGISVSVVDEQAIRNSRVEKVTDIVLFSANTSVKENTPGLMPVITIRGVGLNDFNAANNPAAGVYVDDVSLSSLALMSSEFIDLASVEVLKGPQGTLYGRNSTAGALNFRSAQPNLDQFEARVSGGVGSYNSAEVETMVNAPLNDSLGIRFSAKSVSQKEGYWENRLTNRDVGERDELTARLQALWLPDDGNTSVLLKLEHQKGRSELGSAEFFGAFPTASFTDCPGSPHCSDAFGYTDTDDDPYKGDWSGDPDYDLNQSSATLKIETDLGFADLTSITGYIDFDREYSSDIDSGPAPLVEFLNFDKVEQFSEELRLSGSTDIANWQTGVFYAVDRVKTGYDGTLGLFNTTSITRADQEAKSKAIFANVDWLLSEELTLITGLRFSHEEKTNEGMTQDLVSALGGSFLTLAPFGSAPITMAEVDDKISESSVAWKLGLNWKPNDRTLVYTSITEGTKSGGFFTGFAMSSVQLQPYEKETLRAYEIGLKHQIPEWGISYELNTFYYDYQDVQTFIRDVSGSLPVQRLSNVDRADIYGADLSLRYRPRFFEGLTLDANWGLLKTELGEFVGSTGAESKGNDSPDSPKTTVHLGVSYDTQLTDSISAQVSLSGRFQDKTYRDAINDPLLESESYWVINGHMGIYFGDDLELSIWGKNLKNEEYITQGINQIVLGYGFRVYGPPRTYGLTLTKYFR